MDRAIDSRQVAPCDTVEPSGPPEHADPALDALVREIIGRVADKWTMLILETLHEHGRTALRGWAS